MSVVVERLTNDVVQDAPDAHLAATTAAPRARVLRAIPQGAVMIIAVPRSCMVIVDGVAADWRVLLRRAPAIVENAGERPLVVDAAVPAPLREIVLRKALEQGCSVWLRLRPDLLVPARERDVAIAALWRPMASHRLLAGVRRMLAAAERYDVYPGVDLMRTSRQLTWQTRSALARHLAHPELAPVVEAVRIPGIGEVLVAGMIRHIVHPLRFPNLRSLWSYSGLGVRDGVAARTGNKRLKYVVGLIPPAIVRHGDPEAWGYCLEAELGRSRSRLHAVLRARRRVARRVLAWAWWRWRCVELDELRS